jgi:two-component system cell cycle sensor histidine kinase/response regulator CckA
MGPMTASTPRSSRNRLVPPLIFLLGLALTVMTFDRIRDADADAIAANREAGAVQLGSLLQSMASSLESELTSTADVAAVTGGDPAVYRSRVDEGGGEDSALLALRPELSVAATSSADEARGGTVAASIVETVRQQGFEDELLAVAEAGSFRFLVFDRADGERGILLAAGAGSGERAFVAVRLISLGPLGPLVLDLSEEFGVRTFAVYAGAESDPGAAVLASTTELPLTGAVASDVAEIGDQELLVEVLGFAEAPIPPVAVLWAGGVLSLALASLLFVSQRRRNQAIDALRSAREADEARIRMESDLQQAQRMDAVGQLAGGIAHDFNNLLAAITSTAELIAEDVTDPRTQEDLDEIKNAARRGAALTRRLLSFARRDVENREVLDLNDVVDNLEPLLRRSISEDVLLDLELQPGALPIIGDAGEIEQILLNLVVNARDAGRGDDRITVSTVADDDRAVLRVTDRGVGMTDDVIQRVFEPFFSTKTSSGGTGLGLSIVYGIVNRMEGDVRIESTPGKGTTVIVSMPLQHEGAAAATVDEPIPVEEAVDRVEDILLVEDEPTVRRATRRLLERAGHRVVDVGDGIEAIAVVEDGYDPTVVLTDVVLPGSLNGRDLANRILQMVPSARVVFASGYPSEIITRRQLLDEGARFLAKPFNSAALLEAVRGDEPVGADR